MKHFLIRAGVSPLDNFDASYMAANNSIGSNVGNLVYAYSIFRTLMKEDVKITPDYYKINPNQAAFINEHYDGYIIPLADAFRDKFAPKLRAYTDLINRLTIPVYVVGVGLSTDFDPKAGQSYAFDDDVRNFVKAVLNKSAIVGVRGQITADYLTGLGFREDIDHMVIGCPSMYMNGRELVVRDTTITKESIISVNNSPKSPDNVLDFIDRSMREFDNHHFIPQWLRELRMSYLGGPDLPNSDKNYPYSVSHSLYQEDRVRYFLDVPSWHQFLESTDLSFGARLHGNVAAILAGTPSIIIPKDGRMRELAEYHNMNFIYGPEITDETSIWDVIEQSDFQSVARQAPANFDRYIHFLNQNKIPHIYEETNHPSDIYFDKLVAEMPQREAIPSFFTLSQNAKSKRWMSYVEEEKKAQERKFNAQKRRLDKKVKALQSKVDFQKRTLDRKAVKTALKAANLFTKKS